jgi:hypothetical protein
MSARLTRFVWVVRKGATPAFPGQRGFVGGTMGESLRLRCAAFFLCGAAFRVRVAPLLAALAAVVAAMGNDILMLLSCPLWGELAS